MNSAFASRRIRPVRRPAQGTVVLPHLVKEFLERLLGAKRIDARLHDEPSEPTTAPISSTIAASDRQGAPKRLMQPAQIVARFPWPTGQNDERPLAAAMARACPPRRPGNAAISSPLSD